MNQTLGEKEMSPQKRLSIEELREKQQNLYKVLKKKCPDGFVKDGIVDYSLFHSERVKILWILKETNDPKGDTCDLCRFLQDPAGYNSRWKQTWRSVVAVSHGIIEGFSNEKFPRYIEVVSNIEHHIPTLKKVAVINVNKRSGSPSISRKRLSEAFKDFNEDILTQIDYINPNIIIGGNTLRLFDGHRVPFSSTELEGKLWIAAWHPAQRQKCSPEEYYNSIIGRVKAWRKKKTN
jgi:hypothetical protein